MKSSDIKPWTGYAYYASRVSPEAYHYYQFGVLVPMDTRVWHSYNDTATAKKVYEPGRKALGYGTEGYSRGTKPYIEECGVPCMVANQPTIGPHTTWTLKLIDPRLIWNTPLEPLLAERQRKNEEARQKQAKAEQLREMTQAAHTALMEAIKQACPTAVPDLSSETGGYVMPWSTNQSYYRGYGVSFATLTEMQWLTKFITDHLEMQEEYKDLLYELED